MKQKSWQGGLRCEVGGGRQAEARGEIRLVLSPAVPGCGGHWRVEGDTFCLATLRDARLRDVIASPWFTLTFPLMIVNFIP